MPCQGHPVATGSIASARRLANLHAARDRAVWLAYGWDDARVAPADEAILEPLLALNGDRAIEQGKLHTKVRK